MSDYRPPQHVAKPIGVHHMTAFASVELWVDNPPDALLIGGYRWVREGSRMSDDTYLLDASKLFTDTLCEMMDEYGLNFESMPRSQVDETIRACVALLVECYAEFVEWVQLDERERTMAQLRRSIAATRPR